MKHPYRTAGILAALTLAADIFLAGRERGAEAAAGWARLPGLFAALGFGGAAALVWLAKWLGAHGLARSEDYYRER